MAALDVVFVPLANAVGVPVDQVKMIVCILVAFPLGSVFIRIPAEQPALRHLFNIAVSTFFLLPVLNLYGGYLQLLLSMIATYVIALTVRTRNMPWIVFAVTMAHLTINHVVRVVLELGYEVFEITGPQMVLTMKLTTFAWNVLDGRRAEADLDKWQLQKRITKYPSLLEFLGYSFYFPGFLIGPPLEYADYMALINESVFKPISEKTSDNPKRRMPKGRKRVAYRKMAMGFVYMGIYVFLIGKFNYGVAVAPWFATKSLSYRIVYFQICGFLERSKFYGPWTLTEGASILTGLGFTGYDAKGRSLWEGAANVDVLAIEFPSNFKVLLDSWNIKTNVWLRECVYKRVTPKGKKPGFRSSMITFTTSAFWHGIASGYYLSFIFGGFVTTAARLCRRHIRPLVLPPAGAPPTLLKHAYDALGTLVSILIVNYAAAPFILLTFRDSMEAWHHLGWYGFWMIGGTLAFFYSGGERMLRGIQGHAATADKDVRARTVKKERSMEAPTVPPIEEGAEEIHKKLSEQKR